MAAVYRSAVKLRRSDFISVDLRWRYGYGNNNVTVDFETSDPGVVTVTEGSVSFVGAGLALVTVIANGPVAECPSCLIPFYDYVSVRVEPKPKVDSLTPSRGVIGGTTTVVIEGSGFGENPSIQAGTGITVTINSKNDTQINASFVAANNTPAGNHAVTVTSSDMVSNSVNFFVQVPTSASLTLGAKISWTGEQLLDCFGRPIEGASHFVGYSRCGDYVLQDQASNRINAVVEITEDFTVQSTNLGLNSHTGSGDTDTTGLFKDFLSLGNSTSGPPPGGFAVVRQIMRVATAGQTFTIRVNCLNFGASDVTVSDVTAQGVNVNCTAQ